jgi:ketosteroid isomerase-like protein
MTRIRLRFVPLVLTFALAGASMAVAQEGGAKDVDAAWVKAMKANDVEALVACYAPDAVMWLPDAPEARGEKAIRAAYSGLLGTYTVADAALSNAVYQTSGDLSTAWGNYVLNLKPKAGGDNVVLKGRFLSVSKKVGGKWRYAADLASNEPPPPAPQPATR